MNSTYITLKRLHYTCHRKSSLDFQKQSLSFLIQANVFQSLIISVINGSFFNQATVKCIQQNFYIAGPDPKELNLKSPTPWYAEKLTQISLELNIGVELCLAVKLSTIQLTVKINPGLQLLCFITPCDQLKKNSRFSLDQSNAKQNQIATWAPAFARAWSSLFVISSL